MQWQGLHPSEGAASGGPADAGAGAHESAAAARGIAEMLDPAGEEAYWRENYATQPYYEAGYTYDDYHPGYRAGWEGRARYEGRSFQEVERELAGRLQRAPSRRLAPGLGQEPRSGARGVGPLRRHRRFRTQPVGLVQSSSESGSGRRAPTPIFFVPKP